ncbi:MAG: ATP-binding protein [Anaerolineales bacterium]|nr:ATP-binding protein [Anaerolineales bacterium]
MMDEKTIPISKFSPHLTALINKPQNIEWGEDVHYRALFDHTGESVFIIGMDLHYIAANQQALDLLGYKKEELVGLPVSAVMLLGGEADNESVLDDGSNVVERILKRKDGSTLPVEISASIINNEKNEPAYIQSIARDISERKRSEQALTRYSRILSAINNATARLLRSSNIETMMPEVLASLGEAIDVSSCAIFDIDTFSPQPVVRIQYQWTKKNSVPIEIPKTIFPFIPSILNISGSQFFNTNDPSRRPSFIILPIHGTLDFHGFLGLFDASKILSWSPSERDAAEMAASLIGSALQRTSYEEAIRLNETRNHIILSALPDLLIRLDSNGVILDYTTNPDHPLYLHRDMISGKKLSEIWPQETVRLIMGELENGGFTCSHLVHGFTLPFSASDYESRLLPISATEALIVIRDMTDQARLDRMKSDFINRASHELRTPLTTAILMTELIQDGGSRDDLDQYWRTLTSELNRQKILIDRLLIAGRLESGMMKLDKAPMDLIPVLAESISAVRPIAGKNNISVELSAPQKTLPVIGDKSGLQQVFINLINNAIKFSPKGSAVEIGVKRADDQTHVSITDHGLGIPPEAIPQLFQQFYRAKNVTIAEIPGSGIGLYIVKNIVEGLGGSISVESVQNKGTTITVTLGNVKPGSA